MNYFIIVELAGSFGLTGDYRLPHQELTKYFNRELTSRC